MQNHLNLRFPSRYWSHWKACASHHRPCDSCEGPWRHAGHLTLCARTCAPHQTRLIVHKVKISAWAKVDKKAIKLLLQLLSWGLTCTKNLANSVEVTQFALRASYEISGADARVCSLLNCNFRCCVGWAELHRGQQKIIWRQISSDLPSTIFSLLPCQFKYLF